MNSSVVLTTGIEVPATSFSTVMVLLEWLLEHDRSALFELVQIARDPDQKLPGNKGEILHQMRLIDANGQPDSVTRLIVLAAVQGEGLEFKLVSPVVKGPEESRQASSKACDLRDAALYALTRKVADEILKCAMGLEDVIHGKSSVTDLRSDGANPYYSQTSNGIYLEFYYGAPSCLWTPWGKWRIVGGSGSWKDVLSSFLERFGATLHRAVRRTSMGEYGPVYALHSVGGTPLPNPVELDERAYAPYEDATAAWKELTEQYCRSV